MKMVLSAALPVVCARLLALLKQSPWKLLKEKPGEESLYREEKYASKYEINMLRCIFCGFCEEACPKAAIFLEEDFAVANYSRDTFIYGKDRLVEKPKAGTKAFDIVKVGRTRELN